MKFDPSHPVNSSILMLGSSFAIYYITKTYLVEMPIDWLKKIKNQGSGELKPLRINWDVIYSCLGPLNILEPGIKSMPVGLMANHYKNFIESNRTLIERYEMENKVETEDYP